MSQDYLFQARQMQAMSFAVHIPLVCFAIALPSLVVFTEWLHLRTGDPLYRTLARRWSKVMIALFAVGVVTGTVLSFELGLLWPAFMATFGDVFGVAFAAEGFSFFVEAIFIAIYVYGWDRLSPRMHLLSGIPVVIAGFAGSLFVISVNGWMNHPGGFALRDGRVVDVHPFSALFANSFFWHELIHMYLGGFIVTGFAIAAAYAWGWLGGRRGRYHRTALVIPLTLAALAAPVQVVVGDWAARTVAKQQPIKLAAIEGLPKTTKGAPEHLLGWYDGSSVRYGIKIPRLLSDGRFTLGLGAGENLNEHIVGGGWPLAGVRHEMLAEAVEIIRALWAGGTVTYRGKHFDVESAKVWDLPDTAPPIGIAVSGPGSCRLAGRHADAMIAVEPRTDLGQMFDHAGGSGKPRIGQIALSYDPDQQTSVKRAMEQFRWFTGGWSVNAELPVPASFDVASRTVREQDVSAQMPCGPNVGRHVAGIRKFEAAGFTHVALVQVGADTQERFITWAATELLPTLRAA